MNERTRIIIWLLLFVAAGSVPHLIPLVFASAFAAPSHSSIPRRARIRWIRKRPCARPIFRLSGTQEENDENEAQEPPKTKNPFSMFSLKDRGGFLSNNNINNSNNARFSQATQIQKQVIQQQEVQQKQARRVLQTLQALEQQMEQYQIQQEKLFQVKTQLWQAKGGSSSGNTNHDDDASNEYYVSANKTLQEFQSIQEELPSIQQKWSVRSGYTKAQDMPPEMDRSAPRRMEKEDITEEEDDDDEDVDAVTPELIDMLSIDREKELLKEQRRLERLVSLLEEQLEDLKQKEKKGARKQQSSLEPDVQVTPPSSAFSGSVVAGPGPPMDAREKNLFLAEQDRLESEVALLENQLLQVRNEYQEEVARTEELQQKVENAELQLEEQALQIEKLQRQQHQLVPQQQRPLPRQQEGFLVGEQPQQGLLEEIESLQYELLEVQTLYEQELGKSRMLQQIIEQRNMADVAVLLDELQEEGIQRQLILEEQERQIAAMESQLAEMGVRPL